MNKWLVILYTLGVVAIGANVLNIATNAMQITKVIGG
jgi:hypothetical protein